MAEFPYRSGYKSGSVAFKTISQISRDCLGSENDAYQKANEIFRPSTSLDDEWTDLMEKDYRNGFIDGFVESWQRMMIEKTVDDDSPEITIKDIP